MASRGEKIPGYQGYICGMKNHVIGKTFATATRCADEAVVTMRHGDNPSKLESLVEDRPQGRHFLYAQVAESGAPYVPTLGAAHVGKRKPYLDESLGVKDFRLTEVGVGSNGPGTMKAVQSASLPQLPYSLKKFFTGQETKSAPESHEGGSMPGYTGHQHAGQHVYGMSYGHTTRRLQADASESMQQRSGKFIGYADWRPPGELLAEKGKKIPGYQGFIPSKDNHIFGKTYGTATTLAPEAEATMRAGGNASALENLVETRPNGKPDMYAQAHLGEVPYVSQPLPYRVSKGVVNIKFKEQGADNKWRQVVPEDIKEVQTAKHRIVGYTGHTHGAQHVYGESVGKLTRRLHGGATNLEHPHTTYDLLNYKDKRPNYMDGNAPNCL